jgi:hypothetical protein
LAIGIIRYDSLPRSLVSEVRRIRDLALGAKDEEQIEHLTSILDALTACVSSLHERKHEALLNEVLNIPIWTASQVIFCMLGSKLSQGRAP